MIPFQRLTSLKISMDVMMRPGRAGQGRFDQVLKSRGCLLGLLGCHCLNPPFLSILPAWLSPDVGCLQCKAETEL